MSEMVQESNVVYAGPAPLPGDASWLAVLSDLTEAQPRTDTETLLRAFSKSAGQESNVAYRIAKLAPQPLDQLVLAGLFAEGQDIALRRRLRTSGATVFQLEDFEAEEASAPGPSRVLSAARFVEWLGGDSAAWQEQVAQRLLPQAGLAARRLILRGNAATPLEGGVRLTPFLASLLYPCSDSPERILSKSLLLIQPRERLANVVQSPGIREQVDAFLRLCRSHDGPGRTALLWGSAGTGKTLTARAIAGEMGRSLLLVRTGGASEEPFLLEQAAAAAVIENAVLFFDECGRWVSSENRQSAPSPIAAMLLEILQGHPGVMIAAMNQSWLQMSDAFRRRFQFQVCYRGPGEEERISLWKNHLRRPAAASDIERVARRYPLNGGLIANAAARLDADAPGLPASRQELERSARAQMVLTLDWPELYTAGAAWRSRVRNEIDRETRRKLASLGLRLRRIRDLPLDFQRDAHPFKACLWSEPGGMLDAPLLLAAGYTAKVARLIPIREYLSHLAYRNAEPGKQISKADSLSSNSLESAFLGGYLPVLCVEAKKAALSDLPSALDTFVSFSGAGLALSQGTDVMRHYRFIAEWIKIRPPASRDIRRYLNREFRTLEIEPLDEALVQRLTGLGYGSMSTVVRWALARDPRAGHCPGRLTRAALEEALAAYEHIPPTRPAFHA